MSNSIALITEMAILVGIFLLGFLAKTFPRRTGNNHSSEHITLAGVPGRDQGTGNRNHSLTPR